MTSVIFFFSPEAAKSIQSVFSFSSQNLVRWCDSSPCKNGGSCWQQGPSYTCQCQTGWTGLYCDIPSVSCEVAAKRQGTLITPKLFSKQRIKTQSCNSHSLLSVYSLLHEFFFRGGCGSPVQKLRPVPGCGQHSLLQVPGRLHWELLPGPSGRVLTQSLPEWSCLH